MYIPTIADVAYEKIQSLMLCRGLNPGDKVNIDELSKQLDISKTPIRESLKKLEQEGLMVYVPRVGWRVSKLSNKEYMYLIEAQEMIEIYLSIGVADHIDSIDFDELERINNNIRVIIEAKQYDNILNENEKFHMAIYEAYPNPHLHEMLRNIWNNIKLQRNIMVTTPVFIEKVVEEHKAIIASLETADKKMIEKAVRQHFITGNEAFYINTD